MCPIATESSVGGFCESLARRLSLAEIGDGRRSARRKRPQSSGSPKKKRHHCFSFSSRRKAHQGPVGTKPDAPRRDRAIFSSPMFNTGRAGVVGFEIRPHVAGVPTAWRSWGAEHGDPITPPATKVMMRGPSAREELNLATSKTTTSIPAWDRWWPKWGAETDRCAVYLVPNFNSGGRRSGQLRPVRIESDPACPSLRFATCVPKGESDSKRPVGSRRSRRSFNATSNG